jgi:hypothetical protein
MAIKYLSGKRLQGTAAERTALNVASDTTVDGAIFEENDTGKHYVWNATSDSWTEIS